MEIIDDHEIIIHLMKNIQKLVAEVIICSEKRKNKPVRTNNHKHHDFFAKSQKCPEGESNPHAQKDTWPSTMPVYQFQHPGGASGGRLTSNGLQI